MLRISALLLMITLASCHSTRSGTSLSSELLSPVERVQVNALLEKLYQSFSYAEGKEPDWELMRSVFVDGAQFVTEPKADGVPKSQSVDAFILSWQASISSSTSPKPAHNEWITDSRIIKTGQLIRADVEFQAIKSNDPAPRKPGLDSLVLVNVAGIWKILSFVVQYESKL